MLILLRSLGGSTLLVAALRTSKKQGDLLPLRQYEFQRKSGFDSHHDDIEMSDFSNVAKLVGEVTKDAAAMEFDQDDSETKSGESKTGEDDDDDEESGSDDTNEEGSNDDGKEGPGKPFQNSILMVATCVTLYCVLDVESGNARY